ncbi:hypothetical protein D0T49_06900 [Paludibacter sp. 221]|uniref:peptidylprolyl isomerase n=1 Tax=Paludibacter sp. 221 TaxID=2302939 RepID=UPI0013D692A8|nr:peptidylprolyl isomerase [Paludibacter sp. 221]NDV46772.1 hypothetical protein [Paludibacter sp. 221]
MATLEKIRSKGALLVLIIGLALFAFIIGDFLNSGVTYFNSSREIVAEIAGDDISIHEFQNAIDQMTEVYKIETGQNDLNEEMVSQIRNSVWESLVAEKLMKTEAKKIGLTVSKEELSDRLIGNNIHPIILQRQAFYDESGRFNRALLVNFLNSLDEEPINNEMYMQIQQAKSYWLYWENAVKVSILQEKYNNLLAQTITSNGIDAKANFDARQKMADFSYIAQPYYMVPDSVVSVSNNEIKDRYNKDKELYKQEASRSINYVTFDVKPMEDDYIQVQEWMDKLSIEFEETNDVVGLVNSNSDVMYDGRNYSESTVPALLKDFAFKGKAGDYFGPVFQNDTHTMARIMQTGIMTPDSVKLRHIYLYPTEEKLADSLVNILNTNRRADFPAMAREYSKVQETAANGGEIGWLTENVRGVDKEFMSAFDRKVNEVFTIKNAQGIQIVQVMEKTAPRKKVKLAILERKVTASSRTQARIFNDAKQFSNASKSIDEFQAQADERGLTVRPANNLDKNAERVGILPQSRQIVRWAFEANLNNVSDVFDTGNQFIVAIVTEVNKKGYTPVEKVSADIKSEIVKEKKADYMIKNISEKMAANKSLTSLAQQLDVDVKEAENVSFASYQFGAAGFEPYVIGKSLTVNLNEVSAPIKGNSGVYVVMPTKITEGTEEFDATSEIEQLNSRYMYSLSYMIYENMRKNAEIVDNRATFY